MKLILKIVLLFVILSCNSSTINEQEFTNHIYIENEVTDEEYEVYSKTIAPFHRLSNVTNLQIADLTLLEDKSGIEHAFDYVSNFDPDLDNLVFERLLMSVSKRYSVKDKVTDDDIKFDLATYNFLRDTGLKTDEYNSKYPSSSGNLQLSRIAFNKEHTKGVFLVDIAYNNSSKPINSEYVQNVYLVEKINGVWTRVYMSATKIS